MKIFLFVAAFIFSSLILLSCKKANPVIPPVEPPPLVKDTITISLVQVTHTSIVINIKTTANNLNSTIELYRQLNHKDTLAAEYLITVRDTTITDDDNGRDLLLDTEYKYYAVRKDSAGNKKDTSNLVAAKTLAATNFNYTWQEYSIGEPGSVLYDVWGTDENNVYAVGGVYFNDTSYGVIHWNGYEWTASSRFGGGYSIHGFTSNDIWTAGGTIYHFDGQRWNEILFEDQILVDNIPYYSVWGTNSSDLYFGSDRGKVIHWDGSSAEIVYSNPANVYVNDLDGYSSDFIIGVGTGIIPPLLAVYFDGNSWNHLPINSNWSLNSVSIVTRKHIYFGGDGIFELKSGNFSRVFESGYYIWDIEYNKQNGITVASGDFDGVYINNGLEWRNYKGQITSDNTSYAGIFLTNNTIFCVGSTVNEAKIIIGKN